MTGMLLTSCRCCFGKASTEQEQRDKCNCSNQVISQLTVGPKQTDGTDTAEQTQQQVEPPFQITFHEADEGVHAENTEGKDGQYLGPAAADKRGVGKQQRYDIQPLGDFPGGETGRHGRCTGN